MADDGAAQSNNIWPLPKFYFQVEWGGQSLSFQEVTGLDVQSEVIEYRAGNSPAYSVIKMPGLKKMGNLTMKKGLFKGDSKVFWDWFNKMKMNTIARGPITISLLDEKGAETMTWALVNAFPTKITGTDMKSDDNEFAIERIEIVHEGVKIVK